MPRRYIRRTPLAPGPLHDDFVRIRHEFKLPESFPDEVLEQAEQAAARRLTSDGRQDMRDLRFVTIDPPGSMDLDQAMLLERSDTGYLVRYAIADVSAFVTSGDAIDGEAWRRGQTIYCPDQRVPLYPPSLGEGAASLLPDQERPALVFAVELDGEGRQTSAHVDRAIVRSHARLAYGEAEIPLLEQIGKLRMALARKRGAVTLNAPAQTVVIDPAAPCGYRLELEKRRPDEDWNAEISLLAGMAAAGLMERRGFGLLRTMGGVDSYRIEQLRKAARGLGVDWPAGASYADFATSLDPSQPHQAALLEEARGVMGHAGYTFFDGRPPAGSEHAGIAARYAHTTAPLRRLADRYVLDLLAGAGDRDALSRLPEVMAESGARAGQVERAIIDDVETRLLEHRLGERFQAVALENDRHGTVIRIAEPAVRARLHADPPPAAGDSLTVELVRADPVSHSLQFRLAGRPE
jgi:exoribonuclease R